MSKRQTQSTLEKPVRKQPRKKKATGKQQSEEESTSIEGHLHLAVQQLAGEMLDKLPDKWTQFNTLMAAYSRHGSCGITIPNVGIISVGRCGCGCDTVVVSGEPAEIDGEPTEETTHGRSLLHDATGIEIPV